VLPTCLLCRNHARTDRMRVSVHDLEALPDSLGNLQVDRGIAGQLPGVEARAQSAIGLGVRQRPNPVYESDYSWIPPYLLGCLFVDQLESFA
jgi:hypothetical protein